MSQPRSSSKWSAKTPEGPRRSPGGLDLRLLAALLGLMFIATPAVNPVSPASGDLVAGGAMVLSLLPIATRARRVPRISLAMATWVAAFAVGCFFTPLVDQGVRHLRTTASAASAALLFATHGREMTDYRWFRWFASVLIVLGIAGVSFSGLSKNLLGGTVIYLAALLVSILIISRPRTLWFYSLIFVGSSAFLAVLLDFRSLIGYTVVVIVAYWGASRLPKRTFWAAGLVGAIATVGGLTWYFLNALSHPLALGLSTRIAEISGRRATSGRDVLWSVIVRRVEEDSLFGLDGMY